MNSIEVNSNLFEVAASGSAPLEASPTRDELSSWIRALPAKDKDKDALLLDAALDHGPQVGAEILRRYDLSRKSGLSAEAQPRRRTVGELLAAARKLAAKKSRLAAQIQAAERVRQEQKTAQVRARYLDQLAGKEQATWRNVEVLIQTKQPNKYDIAVSLLVDLRDLATRNKQKAGFEVALGKLRDSHATKPSLLRRLLDAGL